MSHFCPEARRCDAGLDPFEMSFESGGGEVSVLSPAGSVPFRLGTSGLGGSSSIACSENPGLLWL